MDELGRRDKWPSKVVPAESDNQPKCASEKPTPHAADAFSYPHQHLPLCNRAFALRMHSGGEASKRAKKGGEGKSCKREKFKKARAEADYLFHHRQITLNCIYDSVSGLIDFMNERFNYVASAQ
ncbi:unnamed protein product [Brugia pahangi]|uniref:Uncharacterized protein n=1 Tax=Brugia pahangi TaxID=6280 RepID=A0A0N4TB23_BRUPA|nr:unnamed protein product [Brugia pahangi]VDN95046.1 unnamed protein product [Brugia pahangi]